MASSSVDQPRSTRDGDAVPDFLASRPDLPAPTILIVATETPGAHRHRAAAVILDAYNVDLAASD